MYSVEFHPLTHFPAIEPEWRSLEGGEDMTYFQSYDWYKMIVRLTPAQHISNFAARKRVFATLAMVRDKSGSAILIAPLLIIRHTVNTSNRKGAYILGTGAGSWSDYANYIYRHFHPRAVSALFAQIKTRYGISRHVYKELPGESALYAYLAQNHTIAKEHSGVCVKLHLPAQLDDYNKMLSKQTRQNIRTAKNRAAKAGIEYTIVHDDTAVSKDHCAAIQAACVKKKEQHVGWTWKLKQRIKQWLAPQATPYTPILANPTSKLLTISTTAGELMAFFNYGYDKPHQTIVIMAAGTNEKYRHYSPGILAMHHFIESSIAQGELKCVDFTRGNEPYKYHLGGKDCFNKNITVKV